MIYQKLRLRYLIHNGQCLRKCPKQWKLSYIDKLAPFTHSIATCFGTAFHETLQEYLTVYYIQSQLKKQMNIDLRDMLLTCLKMEYTKRCSRLIMENIFLLQLN